MSPANGHANDSANIPTTAVQQLAPPASDTNIPTALMPNAAKITELIANLEVPFHPSVDRMARHQHEQGWIAAWPGYALRRPESLHRSSKYAGYSGGLDTQVHNSYQREF